MRMRRDGRARPTWPSLRMPASQMWKQQGQLISKNHFTFKEILSQVMHGRIYLDL